jgi:hypothetical protein
MTCNASSHRWRSSAISATAPSTTTTNGTDTTSSTCSAPDHSVERPMPEPR